MDTNGSSSNGISVDVADRRRNRRIPAPHYAVLSDRRNGIVASGRIDNLSEGGCLVIVSGAVDFKLIGSDFSVAFCVPHPAGAGAMTKTCNCRIVRVQGLEGGDVGIGLEFLA